VLLSRCRRRCSASLPISLTYVPIGPYTAYYPRRPFPQTQYQQPLLSESVLERVSSPYELLLLYMAYRVTHRQPPVLYGNIPEEVRYAPATTALMTSF